ncbi:hypothetical protein QJS04_geneDACA007492 [Acorus gramineus]|uniref:Uncharacterized protein n=1 Tax=Acorus gramineus TaxID=55184 RepID=A0AAV9B5I7_ACOGR|nr:hypothetical protein QJS04_geneDACA007492 [Acorus gramineus]
MATSASSVVSTYVQVSGRAPRVHSPLPLPTYGFSRSVPRQRGADGLRVRCQAEEQPEPISTTPSPDQRPLQTPPLPQKKATNPSFFDVLSFGGPGPERINGRLAMLGFASAMAVELASGADVADQLANGGLLWFAGSAALFSVASLVPLLKGVTAQSKSDGVMTSDAEMWNGRFAMLGLVALVFTEYVKGGPLV